MRLLAAVLGVVLLGSGAALASQLHPRETALVRSEPWSYSVGVFNPLTLTVLPDLEVQTHPLLFFVAPNAIVRVPHRKMAIAAGHWGVAGEYGLSVPTLGMRLLEGTLFPAWEHDEGQIGWYVVPRAGLVLSRVGAANDVLTARTDVTVGFALTESDARPLGAPAPLELLFAPALNRYRARLGVLYDFPLAPSFRLRSYGDIYLHGRDAAFEAPRGFDNLTARLGIGADWGFGSALDKRLTFGVAWWNSDQYAIDPDTFERERSNDLWPTIDFIWEG